MSSGHDVTRLLSEWTGGKDSALDALIPIVYAELRRLAANCFRRERRGHTLDSAALVNEAYLRLLKQHPTGFQNRGHFFGVAARLMRQILTDHARSRLAGKRGGERTRVSFAEALNYSPARSRDLLALDDALRSLEAVDPRKCRMIEMKFFGGLTLEETAEVFGISTATAGREVKTAEAWLYRSMMSNTHDA